MTKNVMVTGGNRGIGLEIVRAFAQKGYKVLLACREEEKGEAAKKDIVGGDVHVVEMPLNNEQGIIDPYVRAEAVYGPIDVLINNAGELDDTKWQSLNTMSLTRSLQVNTFAPFTLIQQALPSMIERGYGRVVNMSSGWGSFHQGMEGPTAYAVSKAALNALTVNLANTIPKDVDVTINAACPGWVHTRMGGSDAPTSPKEGADTAIWLATHDANGPNGKFFRERKEIGW
ncbi:SDR family NAD(P)-dependent oxidoreductase [Alteromonas sp. 345S023]|uniref:SDR family NAD(P)-dependent oxidoreductase n=1 Tax=Alteromonas profundi TaxID=2696062 RepID=A0A7X5LMX6_9ALTE|nr:SDR family NAD(P)-dependent oxidoreductase [Alteromonas profundi]NDV91600.1 SDR family NAD(P)-dependent oxidoreductase [Alteromonas profundi]